MRLITLSVICSIALASPAFSQCVIDSLVPRLAGVYPNPIPALQGCDVNDVDITFVFPRDTALIIIGQRVVVPFESYTITDVQGLPAGMTWACNLSPGCYYDVRPSNTKPDSVGCVRVSGVPTIPGVYTLTVKLDVMVATLGLQKAEYVASLTVSPCLFNGSCYDYAISSPCIPVTLNLNNNLNPQNRSGFRYNWNVNGPGLNAMSSDKNPLPLTLAQAGNYVVNYRATVDTIGFLLDSVVIEAVNCSDVLVNVEPDLYWVLINPSNLELVNTRSRPLNNFNNFPLNINVPRIRLDSGMYEFQVWDADQFPSAPDDGCADSRDNGDASVFFTVPNLQRGKNTVTNQGLRVSFYVSNPIDTVYCSDTITVYAPPAQPQPLALNNFVCTGDSSLIQLTPGTASQYLIRWFLDGNDLNLDDFEQISVKQGGAYTVEITDRISGCSNISAPVAISLVSIAPPSIGLSGSIFSVASPNANYTYTWYRDGGVVGTGATLNAPRSGTFWCIATDNTTGCISPESGRVHYTAVGLEDPLGLVSLEVFPNPTQGQLSIRVERPDPASLQLSLSDLSGKICRMENYPASSAANALQWNIASLPAGVYLLRVQSGEVVMTRRVIRN